MAEYSDAELMEIVRDVRKLSIKKIKERYKAEGKLSKQDRRTLSDIVNVINKAKP